MSGRASALLAQIHPLLGTLSGVPLAVFFIVCALTALFFAGCLLQGSRVGWQLARAVAGLRALRRARKAVAPAEVARLFGREPLAHLWAEYADTLHLVERAGAGEVRATVPAEMFFTRELLVDSRLFDEFARHLPGVLTGLGIIGTFAGLLDGLGRFDATSTASAVAGLKPLLEGVAHAFTASAIAIACAMAVTFTSKLLLALLYRQVERLVQAIDALYATGAGEEYLARLVRSSERGEAQAAASRQALVDDLSLVMTRLADRQLQAQAESQRLIGSQVGESVAAALAAPLARLAAALETSRQGQAEAVSGLMQNALGAFADQLDGAFGIRMRALQEQTERSIGALAEVGPALRGLVEGVEAANARAAERMGGALDGALKQSAARQGALGQQFEALARTLAEHAAATQRHVEAIGGVSAQAVAGIHAGAAGMSAAAQRFEAAGGVMAAVFERSALVAGQLGATALSLQATGSALRDGLARHEAAGQAVQAQIGALAALVENARKEAGLSRELLGELEAIVGRLGAAQAKNAEYLDGVNRTLAEAFEAFGRQLHERIGEAIAQTDRHLGGGVQQLNGVVQEIGAALARLRKA